MLGHDPPVTPSFPMPPGPAHMMTADPPPPTYCNHPPPPYEQVFNSADKR